MRLRKTFFLFFHILSGLSVSAQNEEALLKTLANARHDSDRANIYIDLHNTVFKTDLAKAENYAEKIVEYGRLSGLLNKQMTGYRGLARCKRKTRNYPMILHYDSLAMEVAKKINTPPAIFTMEMDLATDLMDGKMVNFAKQHLLNAEKIAQQLGDLSYQAKVQNRLGWFYAAQYQHTQAISYFEKALAIYEKQGDQKMIAETKRPYAESLVAIGKTAKVPELLFGAIEYFRKANAFSGLGYCLALTGQSYYRNGDMGKALEHFFDAKKAFATYNNQPDIGMVMTDIAGTYLSINELDKALSQGDEAEKILNDVQYEPGLVSIYTFWGRYYTETNELSKAEMYFNKASDLATKNELPDMLTDNLRYFAILKRKQKNNKGADSLEMNYAERIVKEREQATIINDLKQTINRNNIKDTNTIKLLSIMYSPGGVHQLKKQLNGRSLSDIIHLDTLLLSNAEFNSTENVSSAKEFNRQLLDVETQYKTRLIKDSLTIEKQNTLIAKQETRKRSIIVWLIAGLCLVLAAGLWLQFKSRQKAVQAKKQIQLLQNEIHHRVKNNLGVISRLVDVAGKTVTDAIPLSTLKSRIKSIELLHKHLYSQTVQAGNISLSDYITELCNAIGNTFEDEPPVQLTVKATGEVSQPVAEKLGLIINELVTNAYKYAFTGKKNGNILVQVNPVSSTEINLQVRDDGKGMDAAKSNGYGMKLIKGLTHELGGAGTFTTTGGTIFQMSFPMNE
ncbi:MAG: histidine kinase dimerization/phosphoacceptor domain -containing protein [Ferruginibacter sp.]